MIHPIIRQIVDRCHVGDSDAEVIDYVISRLKDKRATYDAWTGKDKTKFRRQIKAAHRANQKIYKQVMTGRGL